MGRYVTPEEEADYGNEFLDVVGRKARESTEVGFQHLQQHLNRVENQLLQETRQRMISRLDSELSGWRVQNEDLGFIRWLAERDGLSGRTRQQLLTDAWSANDPSRVIAIFRGYAGNAGAPRQGNGYAPQNREKIITRKQIEQFHKDVAQGRYVGREQEKLNFDYEMVLAAKEGRIR